MAKKKKLRNKNRENFVDKYIREHWHPLRGFEKELNPLDEKAFIAKYIDQANLTLGKDECVKILLSDPSRLRKLRIWLKKISHALPGEISISHFPELANSDESKELLDYQLNLAEQGGCPLLDFQFLPVEDLWVVELEACRRWTREGLVAGKLDD